MRLYTRLAVRLNPEHKPTEKNPHIHALTPSHSETNAEQPEFGLKVEKWEDNITAFLSTL